MTEIKTKQIIKYNAGHTNSYRKRDEELSVQHVLIYNENTLGLNDNGFWKNIKAQIWVIHMTRKFLPLWILIILNIFCEI